MPPRRKKKQSGSRRAARWLVRLAVLAAGLWLLHEAWTFPDVSAAATRNPDRTSFMRYREDEAKAARRPYRLVKQWVPLSRISPRLQRAVIAAEDARFYQHHGFDRDEIKDALEDFSEGKKLRGASTISQQLAKNLWLGPQKNPLRKAREALYTWLLERRLKKTRILELYLNVVEWGPGVFGAEAASRHFFSTDAERLDDMQAALLAAALPDPLHRNPGRPSPALTRRARRILARMGGEEPAEASAAPEPASPTPPPVAAAPEASSPPSRTPAAATPRREPSRAPEPPAPAPSASARPSASPAAARPKRATPSPPAAASPRATALPAATPVATPADMLRPPAGA